MKFLFVILATILTISCGHTDKKSISSTNEVEVKKTYDEAMNYMQRDNFKSAIQNFNTILNKYPSSKYEQLVMYNLASSYEAINDCRKAGLIYQKLVRVAQGNAPRTQAEALLRMSYVYECLGQDEKVISSLQDAYRKKNVLPSEVADAEIPARLAGAYARRGQHSLAKKYFEKARQGLKLINNQIRTPNKKKEILAKTFYLMGSYKQLDIKKIGVNKYIESLKTFQPYLLRAAEFTGTKWSSLAVDEIVVGYDKVWTEISREQNIENSKPLIRSTEKAIVAINMLKLNRLSDPNEDSVIKSLFATIDEKEEKFKRLLASMGPGLQLTEEAKRRLSIKKNPKKE